MGTMIWGKGGVGIWGRDELWDQPNPPTGKGQMLLSRTEGGIVIRKTLHLGGKENGRIQNCKLGTWTR